jgi:hypothetical protein
MDLSKLAPSDAAVALRSLERRYRALLSELGEEESPDDVAQRRAGATGWSVLEHIVAAAWAIAACGRAAEAVLTTDTPRLDATDVDHSARPRPGSPSGTVHERLAELGIEAGQLANRVERVASHDWERAGVTTDGSGRRVTVLDVVRAAVDAGVSHLRAAEQVLAQVRDR